MMEKLSLILNDMAPIRSIQIRKMYAPWMSQLTKEKIKERDLAMQQAVLSKKVTDWQHYKYLRNSLNKSLKIEKKQWHEKKLDGFGKDSRTAWKNVRNWLGWSNGGAPTKLMDKGVLCSKPKILVRIMNEFFINKIKLLREKIPESPGNPISLVQNIMQNKSCTFSLKVVHPDEVLAIISNLKSTQSCGIDNIDAMVLKHAKHQLTPVITHLINLSIQSAVFPDQWKIAKVVPLYKKGEVY